MFDNLKGINNYQTFLMILHFHVRGTQQLIFVTPKFNIINNRKHEKNKIMLKTNS